MDYSLLEHIAEDLISHKLQQNGLLVAKPKSDRMGTDLLAFAEILDNVKFCRIQCKGRSLKNTKNSEIKIPKEYVTNGFIVILYLEYNDNENIQELYIFFPSDIEQWKVTPHKEYKLNLSLKSQKRLNQYKFDSTKADSIKALIKNAETNGEFNNLISGSFSSELSLKGNFECEIK